MSQQTGWKEYIFIWFTKYDQSTGVPYEAKITKLIGTFNIDIVWETMDSSNNGNEYTSLKNMKALIKYGELSEDSKIKEED